MSASIHCTRLAVGERLAEGRALLGVGRRHFQAALGDAERARAVLDAADIEPFLAERHALAFLADQVRGRHAHVVEHDLPRLVAHHGLVLRAELHARRVHVDQEHGDAAARALAAVGRGQQLQKSALPAPVMKRFTPLMT